MRKPQQESGTDVGMTLHNNKYGSTGREEWRKREMFSGGLSITIQFASSMLLLPCCAGWKDKSEMAKVPKEPGTEPKEQETGTSPEQDLSLSVLHVRAVILL